MRLTRDRREHLLRLLDDDSEVVRKAVVEALLECGSEGVRFLRVVAEGPNRILATSAREILAAMGCEDVGELFRRFIRSCQYELETGCLLMERTQEPGLDTAGVVMFLDRVGARCREIMVLPSSPLERCKVINRVLFHEFGFRGDVEHFYDPRNSFLSQVIARRKGMPITLSILYLLVAQRCQVPLEAVSAPGRFLVGCFQVEPVFYVDAFDRGAIRSEREVRRMLKDQFGTGLPGYLGPAPVGEVLCRCCRNLVQQFERLGQEELARQFAEYVHEFHFIIGREDAV